MEQLKQLGARLLGKKCVAIILGLLGLCGPSSLWAEKLDTTFVLDMVIDSTPCYYARYNNTGQRVAYGIYRNGGDLYLGNFFRINTGYITNENGDTLETLLYKCDNVTKQWFQDIVSGQKFECHDNGMLSYAQYTDSTSQSQYLWDHVTNERIERRGTYLDHRIIRAFGPDGYCLSFSYLEESYWTQNGFLQEETYRSEDTQYDALGNIYSQHNIYVNGHYLDANVIINTYDDRQNLISSHTIGHYDNTIEEYTYDSLDRRIKAVRYDSTESGFIMEDSVVYTYGHSLREGEPYILLVYDGKYQVDSFSVEQFHYDFSNSIPYSKFSYIAPSETTTDETFDAETNTLSVTVKGANYDHDSTDANTYTFVLKKIESYITGMSFKTTKSSPWQPVEDFSPGKYSYDMFRDFDFIFCSSSSIYLQREDSAILVSWSKSEDAKVLSSHDEQTGIITLEVRGADYDKNPNNVHVYTFAVNKKIDPYISSLQIHGNDFDDFSPNKYDYELPLNFIVGHSLASSDCSVSVYPEEFSALCPGVVNVVKEYDYKKHTLICDIYGTTYRFHFQPSLMRIDITKGSASLSIPDFSPDKLEYELPYEYKDLSFKYYSGNDPEFNYTTIKESFNDSTNTLTLSVFFDEDSSTVTEYHIHFRPTDGVDDFLGDQVNLYVMDKTICVDGAEEPLFVYDLLGALVGTGRGEEVRIPVPQTGVYVVKAGGKATKVVVR